MLGKPTRTGRPSPAGRGRGCVRRLATGGRLTGRVWRPSRPSVRLRGPAPAAGELESGRSGARWAASGSRLGLAYRPASRNRSRVSWLLREGSPRVCWDREGYT
ncbi:mCG1041744 [Mus musculus]|nr:mCG1041744 [Mus musculus]